MNDVTGILAVIAPVVAMVLWSHVSDRRRQEANGVRADVHAAANRVLGGDSMLAFQVDPAMRWRAGRVRLSVPGGYEALVGRVSSAVIQTMPRGYELIVHRGGA